MQELHDGEAWSEGLVWTSLERHGAMTGIMKAQVDWIRLSIGAVRPTQGKTLAVMESQGASQPFNAVNRLRVLGRWIRMITIPNPTSVATCRVLGGPVQRAQGNADTLSRRFNQRAI